MFQKACCPELEPILSWAVSFCISQHIKLIWGKTLGTGTTSAQEPNQSNNKWIAAGAVAFGAALVVFSRYFTLQNPTTDLFIANWHGSYICFKDWHVMKRYSKVCRTQEAEHSDALLSKIGIASKAGSKTYSVLNVLLGSRFPGFGSTCFFYCSPMCRISLGNWRCENRTVVRQVNSIGMANFEGDTACILNV